MNQYGQPPYGAPPGVPGGGQPSPYGAPQQTQGYLPPGPPTHQQPPMQQYQQPPMQQPYGQQPQQQGGFMRSFFQGIEQAQPGFGSNYLHPGHVYTMLVTGNKARPSQKKMGGVINFIGEFKVLESTDQARPPASQASYVCPSDKPSTLGNWKAYMAALCGLNPGDEARVNAEITTQLCEFAVSDAQPLAGRTQDGRFVIVRCTTEAVSTQRQGGTYTKHSFMPILPGTPEYDRLVPMAAQILSGGGAPHPQAQQPQQMPAQQMPYGAPPAHQAPPAQQTAPQVPPAQAAPPQGRWIEHPHNPAYEYLEGTQQYRLKGQA